MLGKIADDIVFEKQVIKSISAIHTMALAPDNMRTAQICGNPLHCGNRMTLFTYPLDLANDAGQ